MGWGPQTAPGLRLAGQVLQESLRAQVDELHAAYPNRQPEYPAQWQGVLGPVPTCRTSRPRNSRRFRRELTEFFGRYRRMSREQRPSGTRRVAVMIDFVPWFEPDATL